MASADTLTLAFISAHPAAAARVLERLPGSEAAALFEQVPARAGAPLLAAMLPSTGARILGALPDAAALSLLTAVGAQSAVALLRQVAEPRRTLLVEGLPTATAVASRLLLGYPEDSVGGWVDPDVVTVGPEVLAGEAMARVRRGREGEVEQVYVIDGEHRLVGVVELPALVRAAESARIASLARAPSAALAAASPLSAAAAHEGWQAAPALPVLERGGQLIGVLRRTRLERALMRDSVGARRAGEATIVGLVAHGYWDVISGLAEAALVLLPNVKPVLPEDR